MPKSLGEMLRGLKSLNIETWGFYAFSRDILKDKVNDEEKKNLTALAAQCGESYAFKIIEKYRTRDVRKIIDQMGLTIKMDKKNMAANRVIFALFIPPNNITIMEEPLKKAGSALEQLKDDEGAVLQNKEGHLITEKDILDAILAHEIFHFLEEENEAEIFTRTKKIVLWELMFFRNESTVRALGEIAAMSFSQRICELSFSPFLFDLLLYYAYDPASVDNMYEEIINQKRGNVFN